MLIAFGEISWLAVIVAFVPYFMLGGLWFTVFFKKQYFESLGKSWLDQEKPSALFIVGPAVCTFIITIACAMLMAMINIQTYYELVVFTLVVGLGFLVSNTVNIAINPNIPHPMYYGVISGAYHLVGLLIATSILYLMG